MNWAKRYSMSLSGEAERHHSTVKGLTKHFNDAYPALVEVARPQHLKQIQQIINEISYDHEFRYPDCEHCAAISVRHVMDPRGGE